MRRLYSLAVVAVVLTALLVPVSAQQGGRIVRIWDVKDTNQTGQLTIYNADAEGSLLGMPVGSGDLNGDGYDDVVLAAFYGPSGPTNGRQAGGKLHVWFGGPDVLAGGVVYDAANPSAPTVEIWGARGGDFLGNEADVADVTGDGFADILACAQNADGFDASSTRSQAGALYVIKGGETLGGPINLSSPPDGVIQILGANPGDRLGFWATAGDVDGDGVDDILVSADLAKSSTGAGNARGALYIIPGSANLPGRIDLASASTLRDLGITVVYGIDDFDHFGSSIASGDFDGDGIADVAIGAGVSRAGAAFSGYGEQNGFGQGGADGPDNSRGDCGEVYILYGRASWPATIQMASRPQDVTLVYGDQSGGYFGEDVRAGDFDGDGKDELGVGALVADAPGRPAAGIGYVFWSSGLGRGRTIDARTATGAAMTTIYGQAAGDIGADSLLLDDVDGDGLADVLFGSPLNTPASRGGAGDLKVLFGRAERLPAIVDTADPPGSVTIYQAIAADPADMFTYSLAVGDVDGDGVLDLVPNSMGGDGSGNRFDAAGECYVISGRLFAERAGRGGNGDLTCLSRVVASPDEKTYYAGTEGIELSLFCDSGSFEDGAVAIIRGVEVPTEFVSSTELRVRLDDAPAVRNAPGQLTIQARNPGDAPSATVLSITLVGPTIKKAKLKAAGDELTITIKGKAFLEGATASVTNGAGEEVPTLSVTRTTAKKMVVRIARDAVPSGSTLTVVVLNPGPAPSNEKTVPVP